jgi:hypothetical protein
MVPQESSAPHEFLCGRHGRIHAAKAAHAAVSKKLGLSARRRIALFDHGGLARRQAQGQGWPDATAAGRAERP